MKNALPTTTLAFLNIVLTLLFTVLLGYLLVIGKDVLLPVFIAIISVYVLVSASDWLSTQPFVGRLPEWARRLLVLTIFVCSVLVLTAVVISTAQELLIQIPIYQENLKSLASGVFTSFGIEVPSNWAAIWKQITGKISVQALISTTLSSAGSVASVIFMVVVYAMFLLGERVGFGHKIATALSGKSAEQTQEIVNQINSGIGDYLAVKTFINVILATISFAILWLFGVDFALFWAILIGLLNYIPFVGSLVGVLFPVLLAMVQFGSVQTTFLVLVCLTIAQLWVGNSLEPRMIGRKVNMSPFVVLFSLAVWSSLWGVAGAILAVPLTSIFAIILASFYATRPFAIMLSNSPEDIA